MNPEHMPEEPLHNVVLGGHPTKFKGGYGPVRCFEVDEVRDIARALSRISVNDLRRGFSARAFNDEEIYPNPRPGGWSCREVEGVFQVFLSSLDFLKTQPQPARSFSFMPHDR